MFYLKHELFILLYEIIPVIPNEIVDLICSFIVIKLPRIAVGLNHCLFIRKNGTILKWKLQSNDQMFVPSIESGFAQIAVDGFTSLALGNNSSVIKWEDNQTQITLENVTYISMCENFYIGLTKNGSIVMIEYEENKQFRDQIYQSFAPKEENSNFIKVIADDYELLALKDDGTVSIWLQDDFYPNGMCEKPKNSDFIDIAMGIGFYIGLRDNGTLVVWGNKAYVQMIPSNPDFLSVAAKGYYVVAIKKDGSLASWGENDMRQISDMPQGKEFIEVATNGEYSVALRKDNTLVKWGLNYWF